MQDPSGELRLFSAPRDAALGRVEAAALLLDNAPTLEAWLGDATISASDPPVAQLSLPRHGLSRLVAPIVGREGVAGFLSLLAEPRRFGEADRLAVGRGAAACAIELARRQAAIDAQDQLQIGVADELLMGSSAELEAVRERALRLGYDLLQSHAALVLQLPEGRGTTEAALDLPRVVERELGRRRVRAPLRPRGQSVSVLYPLEAPLSDLALKKWAEELRSVVAARLGRPDLCAGLGRLHDGLEGLRTAHAEAEQALSLGLLVIGTGRVIFFGDLGLYRLLFNLKEKDQLRAFHDEMLDKLVEYDRRNGAELVSTLAAYFAARNSPTEAAERMHLHRNTFLYRLHRIRDITGLDLDDPETRLSLHLALRIGDTLRAMAGHSREGASANNQRQGPRRGRPQGTRVG
jgi:purine catabolism regulator